MFSKYLIVFLISMVPLIELRGAIPVAVAFNADGAELNISVVYIICILGNMIPVPFIYLFARRFLEWGQDKKVIGGICTFFLVKGEKGGKKLEEKAGKGLFVALMLFVGIPLPGTGAWTGTLAASLLDMNARNTIIAVLLGVIIAGVIMSLASMGVFGALSAVFANSPVQG
ncbi:MAG: small multi-drug export protein [Treponema sp.]|nr:small multi-drug export protein [Treponema sp.]